MKKFENDSDKMKEVLFLGTDFTDVKGGVAFVLSEYKKIFPESHFISTTKPGTTFTKLITLCKAVYRTGYLLLFNKDNIKIVHIHGASYHSFYRKFLFFKIAKLFNRKVVYHIHGAEFHLFYKNSNAFDKKLIKNFIENVDCLICLSEKWKLFFAANFNQKNIQIIPNIVPIATRQHKSSSSPMPIVFLFLGHISERKGVWLLMETLRKNKAKLKGKVVFQIGGNGEVDKLQKIIIQYRIEELVEYIGWISGKKKAKYLSETDIFILPSYNEGLPISVLEAMAYEVPVLTTKVGGIPEIIEDKVNGVIIEPGSEKQLLEAILFMVNSPMELKKYGERSKEIVKRHYPENVKAALVNLYKFLR